MLTESRLKDQKHPDSVFEQLSIRAFGKESAMNDRKWQISN